MCHVCEATKASPSWIELKLVLSKAKHTGKDWKAFGCRDQVYFGQNYSVFQTYHFYIINKFHANISPLTLLVSVYPTGEINHADWRCTHCSEWPIRFFASPWSCLHVHDLTEFYHVYCWLTHVPTIINSVVTVFQHGNLDPQQVTTPCRWLIHVLMVIRLWG